MSPSNSFVALLVYMTQVHMPARVCLEALAQRPPVQAGGYHLQGCSPDPYRARQGQEPLAQCRLTLWSLITGNIFPSYVYTNKYAHCMAKFSLTFSVLSVVRQILP